MVIRWMRQNEDGCDLVHNNDDNENVKKEEVLNLMIIKIVIILMEVMWAKEDVLHLGHSGWQLGAQGAPSVSTQRLVRPGAASDLQEGTPIIYKNTHTILILNPPDLVQTQLYPWCTFISLQSIINVFALPQLLQYFLSFFTIADPDLLGPSQYSSCFKSRSLLRILSIPLLHCCNLLASCS